MTSARSAGTAALVVAVVAVFGLVGWALVRDTPESEAPPEPARIAVLGDSVSAGLDNTVVWPSLLASATGASVTNFSIPAVGYLASAGVVGTLAAQVDRAVAAKPDHVVIFAGLYDVGQPLDLLRQAAMDLYGTVARQLPTAGILVLGPVWYAVPAPDVVLDVDRTLAEAAAAMHVRYVSLVGETWLSGTDLMRTEDSQPTDAGQRVLAAELVGLLTANGVGLE